MIMFILKWREISYLEKGGGLLGNMFQGSRGYHGLIVATTTACGGRGGPHGQAVAAWQH